jgi:hypothetical protein
MDDILIIIIKINHLQVATKKFLTIFSAVVDVNPPSTTKAIKNTLPNDWLKERY